MRNKFFILLFGLLLAVGWTNDASAQKLPQGKPWYQSPFFQRMTKPTMMNDSQGPRSESLDNETPLSEVIGGQPSRAPKRANYTWTANVTHVKSWYDAKSYNWYDADYNLQGSASFTDAVTDSCQMFWFIRSLYANPEIPGIKYSEARDYDLAYEGADYGYFLSGDVTQDIRIVMTAQCYINAIYVYSWSGTLITSYNASSGSNLPTGWSMPSTGVMSRSSEYVNTGSGYEQWYYWKLTDDSNTSAYYAFDISKDLLAGYGGVSVYVIARNTSTTETRDNTFYVARYDYNKQAYVTSTAEKHLMSNVWNSYETMVHGTITPPTENGYTVVLVKLKDDVTDVPSTDTYTFSDSALYSYYNKYVKELQLLTDGLRVNENTADAGTLFAYTGDVNKFFYISKGKLYPIGGSSENYFTTNSSTGIYERAGDRAPFYSMYEEFSPYVESGHEDHSDLYSELKKGVTYPILHDCQSVLYMSHWFTIASEEGNTENRVNSLVLYIPDQRGLSSTRTYEEAHQPTVGMYMIDLYADIEPSTTQEDYYTTTVTWEDNLGTISHVDDIPQTYYLYEIRDKDGDGVMDTTLVYTGPETVWHGDYPVGDPTAYDIYYYVIGTPAAATNPETFFAKSNTDDVTVPGKTDFVGLQWVRYESDFVTKNDADPRYNEVNYYRNWLAPHALSTSNTQAGISAGNVGTTGRILTLYREETPIIDLELVMNGNKAYYRIKYRNRNENQQVEPGYNENTGELNNK